MKRVVFKIISVVCILAFPFIALNTHAQTTGFNHITGKYLEVDGASIYYEEIENEGKPTLLFLHGGFGNIEDFNPILQMFINDYRIIGIDSRGHGKSTLGTNKLTYKRLQLDIEAVIDHLQLKDIHIIGFSDGGVIAYRLAAENRISIQKIVTIGGTWSLSDAELVEKIITGMNLEDFRNYFKQSFDFHQQHNPLSDFDKFAKCVFEMWTDKTEDGYPQESVENISVPTLIVRGNDDDAFPLESAVELTKKINNSLFFNIPFAPHDAYNKYPQIFEVVTKEFLNKYETL
jgi:pimeloyl-ACP methyl ester carboxylesterase